jgi:hypothetical protein
MKVEESVYNGFSIGIKGAYVDMNDPRAPKGVIKGGTIVEVSVVDRPANPSCSLELAKTVGGVMTKSVEMQAEEINNAPDQTPGEYYIPCSGCNGTGEVHTGEDPGASTHACEACGGTGEGSTMDSQHIPTLPATSNEALVAELENDPLADKTVEPEEEKGYNPDQARDERGRFGSGGGGGSGDAAREHSSSASKHAADAAMHTSRGDINTAKESHAQAAAEHRAASEAHYAAANEAKGAQERLDHDAASNAHDRAAEIHDAAASDPKRFADAKEATDRAESYSQSTAGSGSKSTDVDATKNESTQVKTVGEIKAAIEANLTKASDKMHSSKDLNAVRSSMIALIKSELDEMLAGDENEIADVSQLLCSLSMFLDWWTGEASENETEAPFTGWDMEENEIGDNMAYIGLGVSADLVKAVGASDATDEIKSEFKAEVRKALGIDEELVALKADASSYIEQIELLKAEMEIVKNFAAPSDISLMRPDKRGEVITKSAKLRMEIKQAREQAKTVTADAALRELYHQKADELEARLAELEQN